GLDRLHLAAVDAVDARNLALTGAPDMAFLVEAVVTSHRRVDRLLHVPDHAPEIFGLGIERPDVVRPILRAPYLAFRIDEDPVGARERVGLRRQRNVEFLDMPVGRIEPADVGAAVGRVPDPALGVATGVMAGHIEARQLVLGDDYLCLTSNRP